MKKLYFSALVAITLVPALSWSAAEPLPAAPRMTFTQEYVAKKWYGVKNIEWYKKNSFAFIRFPKNKTLVVTNKGEYHQKHIASGEPTYHFVPFDGGGKAQANRAKAPSYTIDWGKKMRNPEMVPFKKKN